jgi:hypothetical protein
LQNTNEIMEELSYNEKAQKHLKDINKIKEILKGKSHHEAIECIYFLKANLSKSVII